MVSGVLIRDASERLWGTRTYRRKLDLLCPLGANERTSRCRCFVYCIGFDLKLQTETNFSIVLLLLLFASNFLKTASM
jgi:hypothetical protein